MAIDYNWKIRLLEKELAHYKEMQDIIDPGRTQQIKGLKPTRPS